MDMDIDIDIDIDIMGASSEKTYIDV